MAAISYFLKKGAAVLYSRALERRYRAEHPDVPFEIPALDVEAIIARIRAAAPDLEIRDYRVDVERFNAWKHAARYPTLAYVVLRNEKMLEHFVSWDLIEAPPDGTVIDVASCRSHFPAIVRATGRRCIAQDLSYPLGLHGDVLGGDAGAMDLPDAFADSMTLHCSFEHFEDDADTRFVREAARVLKPGGRVAIQPMYVHQDYFVLSDPFSPDGICAPDDGAYFIAAFGYTNRFGRHYSPEIFVRRVVHPAVSAGLVPIFHRVLNARDISPECYLQFALTLHKPAI
jgi:SAM-dependent methyltransferase